MWDICGLESARRAGKTKVNLAFARYLISCAFLGLNPIAFLSSVLNNGKTLLSGNFCLKARWGQQWSLKNDKELV
jgi:hypothetical protein